MRGNGKAGKGSRRERRRRVVDVHGDKPGFVGMCEFIIVFLVAHAFIVRIHVFTGCVRAGTPFALELECIGRRTPLPFPLQAEILPQGLVVREATPPPTYERACQEGLVRKIGEYVKCDFGGKQLWNCVSRPSG